MVLVLQKKHLSFNSNYIIFKTYMAKNNHIILVQLLRFF